MKIFYWKLLLWQSIVYGLMYLGAYIDGKLPFIPFILTGYSVSVLFTFVIPMIMIKRFKKK